MGEDLVGKGGLQPQGMNERIYAAISQIFSGGKTRWRTQCHTAGTNCSQRWSGKVTDWGGWPRYRGGPLDRRTIMGIGSKLGSGIGEGLEKPGIPSRAR